MTLSPFSNCIKNRRHELRLSLKDASKRTGIQPSRLHDLEQGVNSTTGKPTGPTKQNIKQLSRGYHLSEDYLLDLAGRPKIEATNDLEHRLLSHFKALTPGHQGVVLALIDELYQLDHQA